MNMILRVIGAGLLLVTVVNGAHADSLDPFNGEQFSISGTATVTAGTHIGQSGPFVGSFTLGSMIDATHWNVTAFSAENPECTPPNCTETWSFTLTFDTSNDTLIGTASSFFTGNGGDSREWIQTLQDGNTTTNPFNNLDLTDPSNSRSGITKYTIAEVPEPPSGWLLLTGFLLIGLASRQRLKYEYR